MGADGEFLPLLVGHGLRGAREAAVFDGRQDADFIREVRGLRKQNTCQVVTSAFRASRQEAGGSRGLVGSLTAPCQHIPFRITAEPAGAPTSVDIFIHSLRHQLASESRSAFDESRQRSATHGSSAGEGGSCTLRCVPRICRIGPFSHVRSSTMKLKPLCSQQLLGEASSGSRKKTERDRKIGRRRKGIGRRRKREL